MRKSHIENKNKKGIHVGRRLGVYKVEMEEIEEPSSIGIFYRFLKRFLTL